MEIICVEKLEDEMLSEQILKILTNCNSEFVPPLTLRSSTTQGEFSDISEGSNDIPYAYFEGIKEQKMLVAEACGKVAGFMSFKTDFNSDVITGEFLPNIYISTVITDKAMRHKGVTKSLYGALLEKYEKRNIFTRTWSTNTAHTSLLTSLGFREFKRISNDRGNGIDTVYYKRTYDV